MLSFALRNLQRHRGRTLVTLSAIIFGVVGLVLTGGFVNDVYVQLAESLIHSQSGHIQLAREGFFTSGSRSPEKYSLSDPGPMRQTIEALPGVDDVMGRIDFSGLINNGRTDWAIVGQGIEPDREAKLGSFIQISAGRNLKDQDRFGILIGNGVANALKLKPGDNVFLVANTAEGALNTLEFEVVGVFQSISKDFDARVVRIPLEAARDLLGGRSVNTLVVSLSKTDDTDRVNQYLQKSFRAQGLETKTWVELNDFYRKAVSLYEGQFGVLQLIVMAMVFLSVANSVNMSVFERVQEFGTMMALGSRQASVRRLILTEGMCLALLGSFLGVLLGVLLAQAISAVGIDMPPPPTGNRGYTAYIRIVPSVLVTAFTIGILATLLASVFPALRIARIAVVDALRQGI